MEKLQKITAELGAEVSKAQRNPILGKVIAPLRLVLVWMNGVNEKLMELDQRGNHG